MQYDKSRKTKCIKALEKLDELYKAGLLSSRVYADLNYEYKNELAELAILESKRTTYDTSFPLPGDVQNFFKALKTDSINFQTSLSLEEITRFYRQAFSQRGLTEAELLTTLSDTFISIVFKQSTGDKVVVIQAVDLASSSENDLRNINIRTEEEP